MNMGGYYTYNAGSSWASGNTATTTGHYTWISSATTISSGGSSGGTYYITLNGGSPFFSPVFEDLKPAWEADIEGEIEFEE
jgi:hypothetical protein